MSEPPHSLVATETADLAPKGGKNETESQVCNGQSRTFGSECGFFKVLSIQPSSLRGGSPLIPWSLRRASWVPGTAEVTRDIAKNRMSVDLAPELVTYRRRQKTTGDSLGQSGHHTANATVPSFLAILPRGGFLLPQTFTLKPGLQKLMGLAANTLGNSLSKGQTGAGETNASHLTLNTSPLRPVSRCLPQDPAGLSPRSHGGHLLRVPAQQLFSPLPAPDACYSLSLQF